MISFFLAYEMYRTVHAINITMRLRIYCIYIVVQALSLPLMCCVPRFPLELRNSPPGPAFRVAPTRQIHGLYRQSRSKIVLRFIVRRILTEYITAPCVGFEPVVCKVRYPTPNPLTKKFFFLAESEVFLLRTYVQ